MSEPANSRYRPLLAIAVQDGRTARTVLLAILLWAFIAWAIGSILRGRGEPFDYAIHNFSIAELRVILWTGTAFTTLGILGAGWSFVKMGKGLWRHTSAMSFGLRFTPNGNGRFDAVIRWYGAFVVMAGVAMIPLGASLLFILATCRYMRDF